METLRRLLNQMRALWQQMTVTRRIIVVTAAVLVLGLILGLVFLRPRGEYQPLFTGLSPEESGTITARLRALNVPYQLRSGGSIIAVPPDRAAQVRVDLAAEGLPVGGGKGFELFDSPPLGSTPFIQNVNYVRALQSELGRSIQQLDPVTSARVHIVQPERTPFVRDRKPTTASVVLRLKPGARLSRSTADSIVALVSRAVEGLAPENVAVVDTNGRLLTDQRSADEKIPAGQIEAKREMEAYLAAKAQDLLRSHLGNDRAIVTVTADVNFQHVRERSERFSPEDRAVSSERIMTSTSTGATGARGIAGAVSNIGRGAGSGAPGGGSTSKQETVQTDYLVSRTTRDQENRVSSIQRLTIAALVDLEGQKPAEGARRLTSANVESLIKQAVGYKDGRDEITVSNVKLVPDAPPEEEKKPTSTTTAPEWLPLAATMALVLGLFLILIFGILLVRRLRRRPVPPPPPAPQPSTTPALAGADPERIARVLRELLRA